jgi:hypothetical protein
METSIIERSVVGTIENTYIPTRGRGIPSGLHISFTVDNPIPKGSYLIVKVNDRNHYFTINGVSIKDGKLEMIANEVGYWARKLDRDDNFDLRTVLGLEIRLVEDIETKRQINTESCWC